MKNLIDRNDSLFRISFNWNQVKVDEKEKKPSKIQKTSHLQEKDLLLIFESCLEHPNLEVVQIADKMQFIEQDKISEKTKFLETMSNK